MNCIDSVLGYEKGIVSCPPAHTKRFCYARHGAEMPNNSKSILLLEDLIFKKCPAFYGTRNFVVGFTRTVSFYSILGAV
jgi:hypothetical protein